jgi:1,4-dihydroxy-2-naphthoate octaprenyltransferase
VPTLSTAAFLWSRGEWDGDAARLAVVVAAVLLVHIGANLTNTLFDFLAGVDAASHADDRTLVDGRLSPRQVGVGALAAYTLFGVLAVAALPLTATAWLVAGTVLSAAYTVPPLATKFRALGEVTIFLCFGPFLALAVASWLVGAALTAKQIAAVVWAVVPPSLLAVDILHANNTRDRVTDAAAGACTLANSLSLRLCKLVHVVLLVGAFSVASIVAAGLGVPLVHFSWVVFPLSLLSTLAFFTNDFEKLPQRLAELHLAFGVVYVGMLVVNRAGSPPNQS